MSQFAAPAPAPRIPALDGVRGLAILMVFWFHYFQGAPAVPGMADDILVRLSRSGQAGVDLFFVLSGFLITGILLANRGGPHYLRNFYARRALRIFPLYYGVLAVLLAAAAVRGHGAATWAAQWPYWAYLQNVAPLFGWGPTAGPGHFWSLAVEEHFYLAWPFAVLTLSNRRLFGLCLGLIAGAFGLRAACGVWFPAVNVYEFTPTRVDSLAFGAALAVLVRSPRAAARLRRAVPVLAVAGGAAAVGLFFLFSGKRLEVVQVFKYTLRAAVFALLIAWPVLFPTGRVARAFSLGWLRMCGELSYGLYVYHPFILGWFLPRWPGWREQVAPGGDALGYKLAAGGAALGLCLAAAWASFVLFERPVTGLKQWFEYRPVEAANPTGPKGPGPATA